MPEGTMAVTLRLVDYADGPIDCQQVACVVHACAQVIVLAVHEEAFVESANGPECRRV
jgi:hypothetical protein